MAKTMRTAGIVIFITGCLVIITVSLLRLSKNGPVPSGAMRAILRPTPSPSPAAVVTPKLEYRNPFNEKTQYANPFSTYENPFGQLK